MSPRYNVKHPETGKWRCFSSIVDDFVSDWMPEEEYEKWRKDQYGANCGTVHEANQMSLEDALEYIEIRKQGEAYEESR